MINYQDQLSGRLSFSPFSYPFSEPLEKIKDIGPPNNTEFVKIPPSILQAGHLPVQLNSLFYIYKINRSLIYCYFTKLNVARVEFDFAHLKC